MINRKLIMAMCAGLTLAGCEMAPKFVRPALPVPPATPTGPAYAAASGQEAIVPADVAWTDFFTDDRLRTVIRTTLDARLLRVIAASSTSWTSPNASPSWSAPGIPTSPSADQDAQYSARPA